MNPPRDAVLFARRVGRAPDAKLHDARPEPGPQSAERGTLVGAGREERPVVPADAEPRPVRVRGEEDDGLEAQAAAGLREEEAKRGIHGVEADLTCKSLITLP